VESTSEARQSAKRHGRSKPGLRENANASKGQGPKAKRGTKPKGKTRPGKRSRKRSGGKSKKK
jgi:hypothetical protein